MPLIEIVSHCWRYSRALAYQLSSLVQHPPKCQVIVRVFNECAGDGPTADVLEYFEDPGRPLALPPHECTDSVQYLPELLQRAIGRNIAARETRADVVWFADCDYYFGPGCLDALAAAKLEDDVLYWPKVSWKHKTHAIGDDYLRRVDRPSVYSIDHTDFERSSQRAIGGVQIVTGNTARARGYCPDSKWQQPLPAGAQRFEFGSDVAFRKQFSRIERLPPAVGDNLYRIRQTTSGVVDMLEVARECS